MFRPEKLKLLIFDMDGTITIPSLDFAEIKAAVGAPEHMYTLEYLRSLEGEERQRKFDILHQFEDEAAINAAQRQGAPDLIHRLKESGFFLALLTRNSDRSVELICKKFQLEFDYTFTRDNAPAKPDPAPIKKLLKEYGLQPGEAVMIGDFWIDVKTGQEAGIKTIFLESPGIDNMNPEVQPDAIVEDISELEQVLKEWNG